MNPNNDKILNLTNKAGESIVRVTVVELLEDAITLAKEGATPDQLMSFFGGIGIILEAAHALSVSHTGQMGRIRASVDESELVEAAPGEVEALYQDVADIEEAFDTASNQWLAERADLLSTIDNLQAQLAKANAPKNGHRTPPVEDEYEDEDLEGEDEEPAVLPRRRSTGAKTSSRDRVREMLASRKAGRGFGRSR
jgi:hypothetical protein